MNHDSISILEVNLNSMAVHSPIGLEADDIRSHAFDVQFSAEYDAEEEFAMAVIEVQAGTISDASEAEGEEEGDAAFTFTILFKVDGIAEYLVEGDTSDVLAVNELAEALASISLSTVRGMMSGYLNHTALKNFILPIVDPAALVAEDDGWKMN
jgi:hypothetical protein